MRYMVLFLLLLCLTEYGSSARRRPGARRRRKRPTTKPDNSTMTPNGTATTRLDNVTISANGSVPARLGNTTIPQNGTTTNYTSTMHTKTTAVGRAGKRTKKIDEQTLIQKLRRKNKELLAKLKDFQDTVKRSRTCQKSLTEMTEKYNKDKQSTTALHRKVVELQKRLEDEQVVMETVMRAKEKLIRSEFEEKTSTMRMMITGLNFTTIHFQNQVKLCEKDSKRTITKRIRNQKRICSSQIRDVEKQVWRISRNCNVKISEEAVPPTKTAAEPVSKRSRSTTQPGSTVTPRVTSQFGAPKKPHVTTQPSTISATSSNATSESSKPTISSNASAAVSTKVGAATATRTPKKSPVDKEKRRRGNWGERKNRRNKVQKPWNNKSTKRTSATKSTTENAVKNVPTTTPRQRKTTADTTTGDVTTDDETSPDLTTSGDVTTPDLTTPDLTTPDMTTPEMTTQDVFTTPEMTPVGDTTVDYFGSGEEVELQETSDNDIGVLEEGKEVGVMKKSSLRKRSTCENKPADCDTVCANLGDKCQEYDDVSVGLANEGSFANIHVNGRKIRAYCDCALESPGWLVIKRQYGGSKTFNRTWEEFVNGFGDDSKEFWIGLKNLHDLTRMGQYILRLDHRYWYGLKEYSFYGGFKVGKAEDNFPLSISSEKRNNRDVSFLHVDLQTNPPFSTFDRDNDDEEVRNCAKEIGAGWWYQGCNGITNSTYFKKMFKRFFRSVTEIKIHLSR